MTWTRPRAETLALPIDALALLIVHDYKTGDGWNWQNWMRSASNGEPPGIVKWAARCQKAGVG
ncbi:hypothetical protein [Amycolatopsis australiensis]|uniref:Uncharacterized protein n=1 Tax=Amycolatopsis australiensis TaxID=546364 RepID=A0A1K1RQJ2_9PSEU|nr:hypothetical protein [Amycolatopsis australiensis]SFW74539.1 hypothetical protein SAMN04489730_3785 [Amycolatopsis australiensis]